MQSRLEIDESTGLLESGLMPGSKQEVQSSRTRYVQIAGLMTAVLAFMFLIFGNTNSKAMKYSQVNELGNKKSDNGFAIDVSVYVPQYSEVKVLENLPWDAISEPYKNNRATIASLKLDGVDLTDEQRKSLKYEWSINGKAYQGETATISLTKTGVYHSSVSITLSEAIGSYPAGSTYTYDFTLANKYVRREIRSLTDFDRNNYFRVLKLLYTTSDEDGKARYGDKFRSAEYFLYKHLTGAGTTDCDHWHDGAGIVTHHAAVSLEFEQSLQSIDPTLSNPYWEYGMDPYLYTNWWDSVIFQSSWYGEANPKNDDHKISDGGLWEGVKTPDGSKYKKLSVSNSLNPYVNGMGMMRSPWNNNPTPEISRHNYTYSEASYDSVPDCSSLSSCFSSSSLSQMFNCLNGATHGPVHIMIGGAWNEGDLLDGKYTSKLRSPNKLLLFKVLWRYGYTRCPETCNSEESCKCSIPEQYIKQYTAKGILEAAAILDPLGWTNLSEEDCLTILKALEDPGYVGEMYSSGASYDPTFWPLHGSAERMVSYKRALVAQGVVSKFDETWAYPSYSPTMMANGAYLDGVCDWSNVKSASDLTLPTCTMGVWCSGHYEDDVLEFTNFQGKGETYTNREMYTFIDPWNEDLPYTYDTFDFDYCADEGYDFLSTSSGKKSSLPSAVTYGSPMRRVK